MNGLLIFGFLVVTVCTHRMPLKQNQIKASEIEKYVEFIDKSASYGPSKSLKTKLTDFIFGKDEETK